MKQQGKRLSSACSHGGITNLLRSVRRWFPNKKLHLVTGGFHIRNTAEERFLKISDYLSNNPPDRLGIAHCTGIDKFLLFTEKFGKRIFYNHTGRIEEIE